MDKTVHAGDVRRAEASAGVSDPARPADDLPVAHDGTVASPVEAPRPIAPEVEHQPSPDLLTPLIEHLDVEDARAVRRAWDYAMALYGASRLSTGESMIEHALGILGILDSVRADAQARAAGILFTAAEMLARPEEQIGETFGPDIAAIVLGVRQLTRLGELTRRAETDPHRMRDPKELDRQIETLRKMLLAFASDIRVVLVRLASRLQTLRYFAHTKIALPDGLARESMDLYAPLANRLGVWQIKWELEDLAFRFLDPDTYKRTARMLDERRVEREAFIRATIEKVGQLLAEVGITAEVSGRPKHIFSIANKMRTKRIEFNNLYDVRAIRIIVPDERACYAALSIIHGRWQPLPREFDDYIARPKSNGYRSLHTVVEDASGRPFEVQIRTRDMHRFAEYGMAAHWRYKEAGASVLAHNRYDAKIAWLRQLLAWKAEVAGSVTAVAPPEGYTGQIAPSQILDDRVYVLTPQARVIELTAGATAVDFAYQVHTDLGHRCRGARVDGAMLPLNTPLKTGQTVEIIVAKPGSPAFGPSRDWLNPQLGFLQSPRARAKVRQWFNALELAETIAAGRALVDKALQREGKTAINLDELAQRLGFARPEELYAAVAKDEFSLRNVEAALDPARARDVVDPLDDEHQIAKKSRASSVSSGARSGVLVVGVDALMTQLAKCCKPVPPDAIIGFVTRGKGISIHRTDCTNFSAMKKRSPERVIDTAWGARSDSVYPVDVFVIAADRQGLLRDISEVFSRESINVVGVNTESRKGLARMRFTAEVGDATQLQRALVLIGEVKGVHEASRA